MSHETRVLLFIVAASLSTLWLLARLRFPDIPVTPNPVSPVLAQLVPESPFETVLASVARVQPRVTPFLVALGESRAPALRIGGDRTVTLAAAGAPDLPLPDGGSVIASDRASRLVVIRMPDDGTPEPETWSPRQPEAPRFLLAADAVHGRISLRPVYIGTLHAVSSPVWSGPLWGLPRGTAIDPGTALFTVDGLVAGLTATGIDGPVLVPPDVLRETADRAIRDAPLHSGELGVQIRPLTADARRATNASAGVMVTWVQPQGPAGDVLAAGDVIETVNGQPVPTPAHWHARMGHVADGDILTMGVRRGGALRDIEITAASWPADDRAALGLTLRTVPGVGSEVVVVTPGSAAAYAGVQPGDILTRLDTLDAPAPSQVARAFARAPIDGALLVAITRGRTHDVLVLRKR